MKVGDLIRDWLRGDVALFLGLDDVRGTYAKVLWLNGKTGWIHTQDARVISQ